MSEPTIAAGFARGLLELAVSKGAGRGALCARSGIEPAELENPDGRVPLAKYVALMRAGKEFNPALALHFGEAFGCDQLSIVGLIGRACETFAEGFAQLNRFARLAVEVEVDGTGTGERFQLRRREGQLWVVDTRRNPNDFFELTESTFARMVSSARRALGDTQVMRAVHVTHAAPDYRAEYERIFRLPVVFESGWNALLTDDSWLTERNALSSRYVFDLLSARAESLLKSLDGSKSVRGRVESLLLPVLHTGEASVGVVAGKMGFSRQTLFRKLKAEGVTFEKVLDDLRRQMALHYLSGKKASVNETAYLVGFSEPAAFSRAFKRWTGSCPRAMLAAKTDRDRTGLS